MFAAFNIVPAGYNIDFISEQTGVKISGREEQSDGSIKITYESPPASNNFEKISDAIDRYAVNYMQIALPKKISEITLMRNQKIKAFKFAGIWIELDLETKANIVGVVSGLDRNPGVQGIDWSLGGGEIIFLNRNTLYALADQAFLYIQGCFSHYKSLISDAKAAQDINDLAAINENAGWPQD